MLVIRPSCVHVNVPNNRQRLAPRSEMAIAAKLYLQINKKALAGNGAKAGVKRQSLIVRPRSMGGASSARRPIRHGRASLTKRADGGKRCGVPTPPAQRPPGRSLAARL